MRVANLTISYGGDPVLEGASIAVGEGQFVSLLGPSGSGKSSLLRAVIGLQEPLEGSIEQEVAPEPEDVQEKPEAESPSEATAAEESQERA